MSEAKRNYALAVMWGLLEQLDRAERTGEYDGPLYKRRLDLLFGIVEELNNGPRTKKGSRRDGGDDHLRARQEGAPDKTLPGAGGPAGRRQLELFSEDRSSDAPAKPATERKA